MTWLQFFARRRFNYIDAWGMWLLGLLQHPYGAWVWLGFIPIAIVSAFIEYCADNPMKGNPHQ